MRAEPGRSAGFTLFEVLIAVSIFAVIGLIAMTGLIQVGRSGERIADADRQLSALQFALARIGKDLLQVVERPVRDRYGDAQPGFSLKEQELAFTRGGWSNLLDQPRSSLQRVSYRVEDGKLIRWFRPVLDQAYEDSGIDQILLEGVDEVEWRLLTRGKTEHERWPLEDAVPADRLPVALQLRFELQGFGRVERIFELPQGVFEREQEQRDEG